MEGCPFVTEGMESTSNRRVVGVREKHWIYSSDSSTCCLQVGTSDLAMAHMMGDGIIHTRYK